MATCYWPKQPKGSFWCNTIYLFATNFTMRLPATLSNWLRNNHFLALITRGHQGVTNQSIGWVTWVNSLEVENLWFGLISQNFIYLFIFWGKSWALPPGPREEGPSSLLLISAQLKSRHPLWLEVLVHIAWVTWTLELLQRASFFREDLAYISKIMWLPNWLALIQTIENISWIIKNQK